MILNTIIETVKSNDKEANYWGSKIILIEKDNQLR